MLSTEQAEFKFPVLEAGLTVDDLLSFLQNQQTGPNSGSEDGSSRAVYSADERKRRRKQSNRESARRSRWRKKRHLQNLSDELDRLKNTNRSLKSRLALANRHCHVALIENHRLTSEFLALMSRLSLLQRALTMAQ